MALRSAVRRFQFGLLAAPIVSITISCTSAPPDSPFTVNFAERPAAGPTFAGKPIDPALDEVLTSLRVCVEIGDESRFQSLLSAALQLKPPGAVRDYLDQLESLVFGRMAARALERAARVEPLRDLVTIGDPISLQLLITNNAIAGKDGELQIPRKVGGGLFSSKAAVRSQLLASVTTTDFDAYGGEASMTNTLPVELREDIKIGAGETYKMEFQIDGSAPRAAVARTIQISLDLMPAQVSFDGKPLILTKIPFGSATVTALPAGYEASALDPAAVLEELLERPEAAMDRSIPPLVFMIAPEQRDRAILALARKVTNAPPSRQRAIIASLRRITGDRERGVDRDAWLGWASRYLQQNTQKSGK